MPYMALNWTSGEVVADISQGERNLSGAGGSSGFADMYVQPFNLGWHFGKRVDFNAGYAFVAPRSGVHRGVGAWAGTSTEERHEHAGPTRVCRVRPMAGVA